MAVCNPNTVLAAGKDFQRCSKKELLICIAQLLCNISAGGGTGGGGLAGVGSPEGVTTANPGTTYLDTASGSFYAKQTGSGNTGWLQLIV
jgi:hypothetical protein